MKHLRAQSYGILSPFFVPFLPQNQHCPISSVQDNSGIKSCQIMLRFLSSAIQMGFFLTKKFQGLQPTSTTGVFFPPTSELFGPLQAAQRPPGPRELWSCNGWRSASGHVVVSSRYGARSQLSRTYIYIYMCVLNVCLSVYLSVRPSVCMYVCM